MIIRYPQELLAAVKKATRGRQLAGFTPGQGPRHPELMLIGEAPGRHEERVNIPFSGASGQELMRLVESIGYSRQTVYITSVVRQRPYAVKVVQNKKTGQQVEKTPNRTPTKGEVRAFAPLFDWELHFVDPQILVPLGNTALQRLLGSKANIGKMHGQLIESPIQEADPDSNGYRWATKRYRIFPMYHPAAILYVRRLEPVVQADWQRLGKYLKENH
ncbi:uracil-DNA glycosylase [Limosilactobacillus kribbianus]|uniref:uracil-DNA glycosylase n=1 Tax=Limosilactobacillus kribbianus TaxID=2982695 RepID=UPI0022641990|nr:uracil-DNA glycosylase [Limosilactobacillus kribbianus]